MFIFKTTWKSYFKNNQKLPGNLLKIPGKIMEISWNFVSPKKWEPCINSVCYIVSSVLRYYSHIDECKKCK